MSRSCPDTSWTALDVHTNSSLSSIRDGDKHPTMRLVLLFCFFLTAHSLAIEQRSCVSPEVLTVSKQVSNPNYFCAWYLKEYGMSNFVKDFDS